jgi:uncharacterized protein YgiM (DUF1202 family)
MEQIMEMVEGAKKGRMMNIKENYYIYQCNHFNKLIQEQKHTKESHNQNSLFDIAVRYQHTPTYTSLNTTPTQRTTKQYTYTQRRRNNGP